jgi:hypothetical protein
MQTGFFFYDVFRRKMTKIQPGKRKEGEGVYNSAEKKLLFDS